MFRPVKVNSDKEPQLSQTLGVSGLPTVFAVNRGKLTDRAKGMASAICRSFLKTKCMENLTGLNNDNPDMHAMCQLPKAADCLFQVTVFIEFIGFCIFKLQRTQSLPNAVRTSRAQATCMQCAVLQH